MIHSLALGGHDGSDSQTTRLARLFGRNTVASFFVFGVDIALLWAAVEFLGMPQVPAAAGAFLIAMSLHYVLSRVWVFRESKRGMTSGYIYFLINAGVGLAITMGAFWLLSQWTDLYYLVGRVLASVVAGIVVFALNAVFNFKAV